MIDEDSCISTEQFFDRLPLHVLFLISEFLSTPDLRTLHSVFPQWQKILGSDKFWLRRYRTSVDISKTICSRFISDRNYTPLDAKHDEIKRLAVDMDVTWLNGNYLKREYDNHLSHEVVTLDSVCFLHLTTNFENVLPGSYNILWLIQLKKPILPRPTRIFVENKLGKIICEQILSGIDFHDAAVKFGRKWFYLIIPSVRIDTLDNLRTTFFNEGPHWKHGIQWAHVKIVPELAVVKRPVFISFKHSHLNINEESPHDIFQLYSDREY
ncbi:hypothetical protein GJ496_001426 [Pomphorhynchus laevis]|nr:hypothetical protein GJ496_001426 [Pomphorhynchus laevis]